MVMYVLKTIVSQGRIQELITKGGWGCTRVWHKSIALCNTVQEARLLSTGPPEGRGGGGGGGGPLDPPLVSWELLMSFLSQHSTFTCHYSQAFFSNLNNQISPQTQIMYLIYSQAVATPCDCTVNCVV